jgi:hypothetical protein
MTMLKHRERAGQSPNSTSTDLDSLLLESPSIWEVEDPRAGATFGAAFFGWLVSAAVVALIAAIIAAVSAVVGLPDLEDRLLTTDRSTFVLISGGLFLIPTVIGLFAGGYVAGRMVRARGGWQGVGVWVVGLIVLAITGALGYAVEREYDLLARVDWPATPIDGGRASTVELILMSLAALATLAAAVGGGRLGTRYHQRFDLSQASA